MYMYSYRRIYTILCIPTYGYTHVFHILFIYMYLRHGAHLENLYVSTNNKFIYVRKYICAYNFTIYGIEGLV